jgi:hypothetical protein
MSFLTNIKSLWIIIIVLIIVNIFSVGAIWLSKDHRPYYRSGSGSRSDRSNLQSRNQHFIPRELNFTGDQRAEFDSLAALHRESLRQKTDEIGLLREQLVTRMRNQEFNSASEELIQQIGEKQAELELLNFRNFRDVMNICDDDQKEKFVSMMQRAFRPRHDDRGGGRRDGRH